MKDPDTQQPSVEPSTDETRLLEQLRANPLVAEKFSAIMERLQEETTNGGDANQAEEMAIESLRELGNAMLTQWAEKRHDQSVAEARSEDAQLTRHAKKNSTGDRPSG